MLGVRFVKGDDLDQRAGRIAALDGTEKGRVARGDCSPRATRPFSAARRTPRKGKNRVAQALRMAAQAVGRTATALGTFYRRIKSRLGGRGAITATAHKLSRLVYRMLRYGSEYVT